MRRRAMTLLAAGLLAGCTPTFNCNRRGRCPQDPAPNVVDCEQAVDDAECGPFFGALADCLLSNEVCNSDGGVDAGATEAACDTQQAEFEQCCSVYRDGPACSR